MEYQLDNEHTHHADSFLRYRELPYYDRARTKRYLKFRMQRKELSWEQVITYVNLNMDKEFYTEIIQIKNPDRITVLVNKYNQLPPDYIPGDLQVISPHYNIGTLQLRREARIAFEQMCEAAEKERLALMAVSAFRSYAYQEEVYLRKRTPEITLDEYRMERDRVSARPGHSEHQTGLAVDINELEETFENTPEWDWLARNACRFGFLLRYPKGKEKITGYDYEPWHFRYVGKKLADAVMYHGLTYDEYYNRYL
jgi:D-alanyl-D-alanine carboxypeptidase